MLWKSSPRPLDVRFCSREWQPLTDAVRWRVLAAMAIDVTPISVVETMEGVPVRLLHVLSWDCSLPLMEESKDPLPYHVVFQRTEKRLAIRPIASPRSLWQELMPFPFSAIEFDDQGRTKASSGEAMQIELSPAGLAHRLFGAYQSVLGLEEQILGREISILALPTQHTGVEHVIAVQCVRKRRLRMGIVPSEGLSWLDAVQTSEEELGPTMSVFSAVSDENHGVPQHASL